MIAPNARLVTERVTNWTLSDRLRRIDLPVGVNYGAHPRKFMDMLEPAAPAHPQVLRRAAPQAFFMGFGDCSINCEPWAWTDQVEDCFQIRSELGAPVYVAGYAAGLSFPFPQREVRILADPGGVPAGTATAPRDRCPVAGQERRDAIRTESRREPRWPGVAAFRNNPRKVQDVEELSDSPGVWVDSRRHHADRRGGGGRALPILPGPGRAIRNRSCPA